MEKPNKVPMIYGYAICLVTVITFIICIGNLVNSVIDRSDPLHAEFNFQKEPSLAAFENYKMDILSSSEKEKTFVPDDATLKQMYQTARKDKIRSVLHRTTRDIIVNGLLCIICIVLFIGHWGWMRKLQKKMNESA